LKLRTFVCEDLFGIKDEGISTVISLAGQTDVDVALREPSLAFSANIRLATDLGEWLRRKAPHSQLIYMSSDEVLGESFAELPESAPLNPTQPYATSKAAAELILRTYSSVYGLNISLLRACNLVGSAQRARKLIPVAVKRIRSGRPVPIYGSGTHRREWMAVEDLCDAIICLAKSPTASGVFQASSNVRMSVLEVVSVICKALDLPVLTEVVADRLVNDRSYAMRTTRLRALGWQARRDPIAAIAEAARAISMASLDEFTFED
jgi:dTDP-glucose 4,6-dehydratase